MRKLVVSAILVIVMILVPAARQAAAHCEIPCGIYDDAMRIKMIDEHITTIEKSIQMIDKLSKEEALNYNQIVRWVTNKEEHANAIQEIVSQYFLTQRIIYVDSSDSAGHKKYTMELTILHQMLVYAMKAKQSVDLENVQKLRSLNKSFEVTYLGDTTSNSDKGMHHSHK